MKIKALAPWFGGKRNLAPRIVEELGKHTAYWEPFCGSMAVLFAKEQCRLETVNDLNGDLVNLARVVRDPVLSQELRRRARLIPCSDEELYDADFPLRTGEPPEEMSVDRALQYLVASWQGRNGECGLSQTERSRKLCIRWNNNGGSPGTRWASVVRSIAAWHRRLERVTVLRRDGFQVLEKIADRPETTIYCDPPYLEKSDEYLHDFSSDDHGRLAEILSRFTRARVVVSYYEHPRLDELYPNWTRVRVEVEKSMGHVSEKPSKSTRAVECLLINGESFTDRTACVQRQLI